MSREFDITLFGATGFTGKLVAEYLLTNAKPSLRIALAGRSMEKLVNVREALAHAGHPRAAELPFLLADSTDEAALTALAQRTRVIITTVGPYAKLGMPLVRAAAQAGTHYVDLTGEVTFIRRSIDECHALAERRGACIVHCCGFDSIPSDLGTWMLHQQLADAGGLAAATSYVESLRGGVSGGTAASMVNLLEESAASTAIRELVTDPYALSPNRTLNRGPDRDDDPAAWYEPEIGRWTAPFVMAQINTRVVRRSNALLDYAYGEDFRYAERSTFGKGLGGMLTAQAVSLGYRTVLGLGSFEEGRALIRRFTPESGEGPDENARKRGGFRIVVRGVAQNGARAAVKVVGHSDPGYGETAKMLSESALTLLEDEAPRRSGVLTPATALGSRAIERLRAAGMEFEATLSQEPNA